MAGKDQQGLHETGGQHQKDHGRDEIGDLGVPAGEEEQRHESHTGRDDAGHDREQHEGGSADHGHGTFDPVVHEPGNVFGHDDRVVHNHAHDDDHGGQGGSIDRVAHRGSDDHGGAEGEGDAHRDPDPGTDIQKQEQGRQDEPEPDGAVHGNDSEPVSHIDRLVIQQHQVDGRALQVVFLETIQDPVDRGKGVEDPGGAVLHHAEHHGLAAVHLVDRRVLFVPGLDIGNGAKADHLSVEAPLDDQVGEFLRRVQFREQRHLGFPFRLQGAGGPTDMVVPDLPHDGIERDLVPQEFSRVHLDLEFFPVVPAPVDAVHFREAHKLVFEGERVSLQFPAAVDGEKRMSRVQDGDIEDGLLGRLEDADGRVVQDLGGQVHVEHGVADLGQRLVEIGVVLLDLDGDAGLAVARAALEPVHAVQAPDLFLDGLGDVEFDIFGRRSRVENGDADPVEGHVGQLFLVRVPPCEDAADDDRREHEVHQQVSMREVLDHPFKHAGPSARRRFRIEYQRKPASVKQQPTQ